MWLRYSHHSPRLIHTEVRFVLQINTERPKLTWQMGCAPPHLQLSALGDEVGMKPPGIPKRCVPKAPTSPGFGVAGDEVGHEEPQSQHGCCTEPSVAEESFIPVPLLNKVWAIS